MSYQLYPSDLADREWDQLTPLLPAAKIGGRPRSTDLRLVVNAICYISRTGAAWRYLPREYPPWKTVYGYFRQWRIDGLWDHLQDCLRDRVRQQAGRDPEPSAAILDSQSVKTGHCGGPDRGYDAGKKVNGRKRHILVDTLGLLLVVVVHGAHVQDRVGAREVLAHVQDRFLRLRVIWADGGYSGTLLAWISGLRSRHRLRIEIVKRTEQGFAVLPKRWIVERTFAWLSLHRRLSKDYEVLPQTSRAFVQVAMIRLMLARL